MCCRIDCMPLKLLFNLPKSIFHFSIFLYQWQKSICMGQFRSAQVRLVLVITGITSQCRSLQVCPGLSRSVHVCQCLYRSVYVYTQPTTSDHINMKHIWGPHGKPYGDPTLITHRELKKVYTLNKYNFRIFFLFSHIYLLSVGIVNKYSHRVNIYSYNMIKIKYQKCKNGVFRY